MSNRPRSQPGPPMTLGNMRANGVRSLDVSLAMSAERPSVRVTDAGTAGTGRMMAVGPPNFRDVTAERVGTVIGIIGAAAAGKAKPK